MKVAPKCIHSSLEVNWSNPAPIQCPPVAYLEII